MEGGIAIAREAESMLGYISDRREFWRQQKPDYEIVGRKNERRSVSAQRLGSGDAGIRRGQTGKKKRSFGSSKDIND